jgi:sucrose-phosphate synthase
MRPFTAIGKRLGEIDGLLIVDIDDTLTGDEEGIALLKTYLSEHRNDLGFGVATGRDITSAIEVLETHGIDAVDLYITSVGSEIYYRNMDSMDPGWEAALRRRWKPEAIREALTGLDFLSLQTRAQSQREFKISYDIDLSVVGEDSIPLIHNELMKKRLSYNLIHSHGRFIDILPAHASKGHAIRYISRKWNVPLPKIITAGNSGNDWDMLSGRMRGIVVENYEPELEGLKKNQSVYFSAAPYAHGILEGIGHWRG